jgi:hypothetical protein
MNGEESTVDSRQSTVRSREPHANRDRATIDASQETSGEIFGLSTVNCRLSTLTSEARNR